MHDVNSDGNNVLAMGLAAAFLFPVCGMIGIALVSVFLGVSAPTSFTTELAAKAGLSVGMFSLALGGILSLVSFFGFFVLLMIARGKFPCTVRSKSTSF